MSDVMGQALEMGLEVGWDYNGAMVGQPGNAGFLLSTSDF